MLLILVPNHAELNNDRVDLILVPNDVELNNDRVLFILQASQWSSSEIQKKYRQKMDQNTEKYRENTEKFIEIQNLLHIFKGKVMYQGIYHNLF